MKQKPTIDIIIAVLVMLLLYTSFSKLLDLPRFEASLRKQPFAPRLQQTLLWLLPSMEILVAGLLMVPRTKVYALWGYAAMMAVFTGYIAAILLHAYPRIPCTCGGLISQLSWPQHLVFNLFFLALGIWALIINAFHARKKGPMAGPLENGRIHQHKKFRQ